MQHFPQFDPTKPFYPFLMAFYASVRGSVDIINETPTDDATTLVSSQNKSLDFDWASLSTTFYKKDQSQGFETALRMLLISCYEVCVQHYDQKDPAWRFFRYVRNAAAHDGRFYLQKRDGKYPITTENPSTWSNKQIHMFMDGDPLLIDDGEVEAFLKSADVLHLLHDMEATF